MKKVLLLVLYLLLCSSISLFINMTTYRGPLSYYLPYLPLPLGIGHFGVSLIFAAVILDLARQRSKLSNFLALVLIMVLGFIPGLGGSMTFLAFLTGCTLLVILLAVILDLVRHRFKTSPNFLALMLATILVLQDQKVGFIILMGSLGLDRDVFAGFIIPVAVASLCLVRCTVCICKGRETLTHGLIFIVATMTLLLVIENALNPSMYRGFFYWQSG